MDLVVDGLRPQKRSLERSGEPPGGRRKAFAPERVFLAPEQKSAVKCEFSGGLGARLCPIC
jgi:hypothetical protein